MGTLKFNLPIMMQRVLLIVAVALQLCMGDKVVSLGAVTKGDEDFFQNYDNSMRRMDSHGAHGAAENEPEGEAEGAGTPEGSGDAPASSATAVSALFAMIAAAVGLF